MIEADTRMPDCRRQVASIPEVWIDLVDLPMVQKHQRCKIWDLGEEEQTRSILEISIPALSVSRASVVWVASLWSDALIRTPLKVLVRVHSPG